MYKKIKMFLLIFVLLFLFVPTTASAEEIASGTCGENLTWTLSDEGVLSISGSGEMTGCGWNSYCWDVLSIVIGDGVTTIMGNAFNGCKNLINVSIPDSVTTIEHDAFKLCSSLSDISIPGSVNIIGSNAFWGCSNLTNVSISEGVTTLGGAVFGGCSSLTNVSIPDSVTTIGAIAFNGCSSLTNVSIPASVITIQDGTFKGCSSLTNVNIPEGITTIVGEVFAGCSSLTNVSIPASVTLISGNIFSSTSLNKIVFCGSAPIVLDEVFTSVTATAYYPAYDSTWTKDKLLDYGGNITWVGYNQGENPWEDGTGSQEPDENAPSEEVIAPESKEGEFFFCDNALAKVLEKEKESLKYTYHYDDAWFLENSSDYNHELAQMSIRVALAGFNANTNEAKGDNAYYIKALMKELGYSYDDNSIHYPDPNKWTIGYAIGRNDISNDTTILMVTVRGGGYKGEWYSNCIVGEKGDHQGFDEASVQVGDGINAYINEHAGELKENVKVWIVGYSRAAAVANLAAADLCNGFIEGISSEDVFAYCFACPQGTIDSNAASKKYSSIKNIVNPIDLVPKVAMSSWDFTRYGVTYYLPFAGGNEDYLNNKAEMRIKYDNILSYNESNDIEERTKSVLALTTESPAQSIAYMDIVNELACLVGNRHNYVNKLVQGDVAEAAYVLMGEEEATPDTWRQICLSLNAIFSKYGINYNLPGILKQIVSVGEMYTLQHPGEALAGISEQIGALSTLNIAHYPELYMAWLDSLDGSNLNYNGRYAKVFINCPVNVTVYDKDNNIVGKIVNDEVINTGEGCTTYIDQDGQKIVVLPCDAEYEIQMTATDNGTVTYTVEELNMDDKNSHYICSYYDVNVETGDILTGVIAETEEASADKYMLMNPRGDKLEPTKELMGEEILTYSIYVEADGHGVVNASPRKTEGEYVILNAVPNDNESFLGWYNGVTLVSIEENYRFRVETDVSLEAKFTRKNHRNESGVVTKEPTCTETGTKKYICDICSDEYNIKLPVTSHNYVVAVTNPTCTEQGYTTYTCSKCGSCYLDSYVEASGHKYGAWVETKSPSCIEKGEEEGTCICGQTVGREVEALGHYYEAVVIEPTEIEQGYTTYNCKRCGNNYVSNYTEPLEHKHNWDDGVVSKEATCTENGEITYTCDVCNEKITESIDMLGHSYDSVIKEPNCIEKGYTTHICERCNDTYVDTYIDATDHTFTEGKCIECGEILSDIESMSFWDKILNLILKIVSWIKNLFK